ncbi:HBL/NHE enterotoxin family protein [Virgibacillus chiguensis]|uniref:Non-hemolytic enterotoxin B/C n=1 Tax=Virgibacillus chiguensis TaxID=411959 RepID=A0A1M5TND5_9BACI|nr:HBL/NHE enterotoxin family protein [Virgibacillus chiguensis]SHH52315.1 non-hemolytic enterotoxin B/C [Virgibacillus chiguensis]
MTKKTKKVKPILLSAMAATVIFSNIAPSYAYAETAVKQQPVQVDQHKKFELGPDGLRDALETTGSNALVMDLYALTVIKQPDINFNNVNIVDNPLQKKILHDQKNARGNAKTWLDDLKPQLITTNQNIINYDNKFEGYYDRLVEAAENKDTKALAARLSRLANSVSDNKAAVDKLIVDLKEFRQKLQSDTQNLKGDTNELSTLLASQDAGIPLLQKQIETYYEAISKYNNILIASSVATAAGPLIIVGGVAVLATGAGTPLGIGLIAGGVGLAGGGITGVVLAKKGIDEAEAEIKNLTGKVTDAQIQLAGVTGIKQQMEYLTETIDIAIDSLQSISTQWNTMDAKYKSLLSNIAIMSPDDFDLLKEDLTIAKKSWGNIKEFAEKLYVEDTKVVDNL